MAAKSFTGDVSRLNDFDRLCCAFAGLEDADGYVSEWYYRRVQVFEEYMGCSQAMDDLRQCLKEVLSPEWKQVCVAQRKGHPEVIPSNTL